MPLVSGSSRAAVSQNIATEERAGKKPKQAEAIAFSKARGDVCDRMDAAVGAMAKACSDADYQSWDDKTKKWRKSVRARDNLLQQEIVETARKAVSGKPIDRWEDKSLQMPAARFHIKRAMMPARQKWPGAFKDDCDRLDSSVQAMCDACGIEGKGPVFDRRGK